MTVQSRLASHLRTPWGRLAYIALKALGVEIPPQVRLGKGFTLAHGGVGVVIHPDTVIGDDVWVFQGVTLGRGDQYLARNEPDARDTPRGGIVVGNRVTIGANAVVLFRSGQTVVIGDDAIVGANSTVLQSIPAGEIWAGSPAHFVKRNPNPRTD